MFSVSVRDHFMIAHSFTGEVFGPAQKLHGATYVVDVEFRRRELDADGIVVDIGRASDGLREVLARAQLPQPRRRARVRGRNTTTEFLAFVIQSAWPRRSRPASSARMRTASTSLRVTLHESHVAWAAYEGAVKR